VESPTSVFQKPSRPAALAMGLTLIVIVALGAVVALRWGAHQRNAAVLDAEVARRAHIVRAFDTIDARMERQRVTYNSQLNGFWRAQQQMRGARIPAFAAVLADHADALRQSGHFEEIAALAHTTLPNGDRGALEHDLIAMVKRQDEWRDELKGFTATMRTLGSNPYSFYGTTDADVKRFWADFNSAQQRLIDAAKEVRSKIRTRGDAARYERDIASTRAKAAHSQSVLSAVVRP
jgi:hypothetical protein